MPSWTCEQCGAQFSDGALPLQTCLICEDDRQFVNWKGQAWLTREQLAQRHKLVWRDDLGIPGLAIEPSFAIGQRALLVPDADSWVMWDCVPLVTSEAIDYVRSLGGLKAIAVSHPHFYGAAADWSEAFGGIPVICMATIAPSSRGRILPSCPGPITAIRYRTISCWCVPADILPAPR